MMKIVSTMLMIVMLVQSVGGCSVPDDDNWRQIQVAIAAQPPAALDRQGRFWHAARLHAWLMRDFYSKPVSTSHFENTELGKFTFLEVRCTGDGFDTIFEFTVEEFMGCVWNGFNTTAGPRAKGAPNTFNECVRRFVSKADDLAHQMTDGLSGDEESTCEPSLAKEFKPILDQEDIVQDVDPDLAEKLTKYVVESPTVPEWLWKALGITVIGGVVVVVAPELLPALCALQAGDGPACPGNPAYPPGQTPQPTPGGDR